MGKQVVNKEAQRENIASVQQTLEKMKTQFAMALPDHIKPERMIRVALTAVQNTPKLLECDRNSFYLAVLRAAHLGLEPDGILGQAYLIPYGKSVQLIPGYKGLIDLARRSGEVSNIIAKEVCKGDEFTVDFSKETPFVHKPKLDGDRGDLTHFWALARFKDGGFHWDYMTLAEVTNIRDGSSGWKTAVAWSKDARNQYTKGQIISPWEQNFVEMGKKTVIRRIAKFLPMSVQRAAVVEDLVDSGKKFTADQFGEIVIEADENTIEGSAEHVEEKTHGGKLDEFAGKTVDQGEGNSSPPEIKPGEPKPILPTFDVNAYNINTAEGVKAAAHALIAVLSAYPQEDRPGVFLGSSGVMVVEGMRTHGLALDITKIEALGIVLPPSNLDQPDKAHAEGATGKTMLKKKAEGAAA
jgi:recombination protein RecT